MAHPATAKNEQSNALAVKEGTVVDSAGTSATPAFDRFLADAAQQGTDPEGNAYDAILQQIMNADSPMAVLTPVEMATGADVMGRPLWLMAFHLNKSEYDVGSPFYVTLECSDPKTGEPVVVNSGHKKVIAQVVRLQQLADGPNPEHNFPFPIVFTVKGRSAVGSDMHELRMWEPEPNQSPVPF